MSKMPALSALLSGAEMKLATGLNLGDFQDVSDERRGYLLKGLFSGEIVPFEITPASEIYWWNQRDSHDLLDEFQGSARLPFDNLWLEWSVPSQVLMNGKLVAASDEATRYLENKAEQGLIDTDFARRTIDRMDATATRMAVVIGTVDTNHFRAAVFVLSPVTDIIVELPVSRDFYTDGNGNITRMADGHYVEMPEQIIQSFQGSVGCEMTVALTGLALINCRNVDIIDGGRAIYKRTTTQKRRRAPDVRFKTIVLPGTARSNGGSQTGDYHQDMALHRVRGHFKTFTAERPLMGKHVGTYWWGWQVRGKADNGINVNDYEVRS